MVVSSCSHSDCKKFGKDSHGNQRFRCQVCGKTFTEERKTPLGTMRISMDEAVKVIRMLLEGVSIRSIERLTGTAKHTILELIMLVGTRARQFWNDCMKGLECSRLEVDETWAFVGMKEKTRARKNAADEYGDAYCFTAIDPVTKLMVAYHVGKRDVNDAAWFCDKLAAATSGQVQITTDGFKPYCTLMVEAFRHRGDFAQLIKIFSTPTQQDQRTYSPSTIKSTRQRVVSGNPNKKHISTSIVERSNLTWRMRCRRLTRLTNGHSKSWQHHEAALGLMFCAYNFCTVHTTLKQTPAVAHGLAIKTWSIEELLTVLAEHA